MKVTGVDKLKSKLKLSMEPAKGGDSETIDADVVIVAVGRRPYTEGLGLDSIGVSPDKRGVIQPVEGQFKVADGVWAVGDCIPGPMLAHKAEDDGAAVAELIAGKAGHVDYNLVPSVVYTNPEIAWVGQNEEELKAAGVDYVKGKFPFMANSRARTNHETVGFVKILAEKGTDRILGAHMIGVGVGELIGRCRCSRTMLPACTRMPEPGGTSGRSSGTTACRACAFSGTVFAPFRGGAIGRPFCPPCKMPLPAPACWSLSSRRQASSAS